MGIRFGLGGLLLACGACGEVSTTVDAPNEPGVDAAIDMSIDMAAMCDPLTPPAFGTVQTSNSGVFPSTATYTCVNGFTLVGAATRNCAANGSWADNAPTCSWTGGARTFGTCGQTGPTGPTQDQCNTAYTGTTLAGDVTVANGIQRWTVPATGTYRITVSGAAGSSIGGWLGARVQGDVALTQGTVLKILVGQLPTGVLAGGGGTFVTDFANAPIMIAGGGGSGNCATHCVADEAGGRIETTGGAMLNVPRASAGTGGTSANAVSGAGGGLLTAGQSGGQAFVNGGVGATGESGTYLGGFGGGGARNGGNGTGGGGGYSGGAANGGDTANRFGGGGGSFNSGTNPVNTANINAAAGLVTIEVP